jgi:DNA adenine methylase
MELMLSRVPHPDRYVTPTLGSGSDLYLAIQSGIPSYLASDLNQHLVAAHLAARDNVDDLIEWLLPMQLLDEDDCRKTYASWKSWAPGSSLDGARRFLFLIGCGVNGIWRESKKSGYNVPFGKRFSFAPDRLKLCSQLLNKVPGQIIAADFADTLQQARQGDLVYVDPPFVDSTPMYLGPWPLTEHERLFKSASEAKEQGASVFISNSDKPDTRAIYKGRYHEVRVSRTVAPTAARRAPAQEVLIEI